MPKWQNLKPVQGLGHLKVEFLEENSSNENHLNHYFAIIVFLQYTIYTNIIV